MREIFDSTVERLFSDLVTPEAVLASESGQWPTALWKAVEESGFTFALAPESSGGAGAGWSDVCGVLRLAGRFNLPLPLAEAIFANWLLCRCGLDAVAGPISFAPRAELRVEGGRVSGRALEVPWGRAVDAVVALLPGEVPQLVLLAREGVGLEFGANIASEPRDVLIFEAVTPLAQAPLPAGLPGDVLKLGGAMLRSAQIAGALEGVLALAITYAGERVQFGKPIGSFQAIQHQIAVLSEHAAASVLASEAAFAESGEALARLPVAAALICSAEAAGVGAAVAHAVHGAIGFTHEHALHLSTRRLWSWRSEFGSLTDWSQQLGRAVCLGGAGNLWPAITDGRLAALEEPLR